MRRAVSVSIAVILLAAVGVAGASAAASGSGSVRVTVRPSSGSPGTRFEVSFTAPASSGTSGSVSRRYEISASGPSKRSCDSSAFAPVRSVRAGATTRVTLAPPGLSRAWCLGVFAGRLEETITPTCPAGRACPQYIAIAILGRFSFRVRDQR